MHFIPLLHDLFMEYPGRHLFNSLMRRLHLLQGLPWMGEVSQGMPYPCFCKHPCSTSLTFLYNYILDLLRPAGIDDCYFCCYVLKNSGTCFQSMLAHVTCAFHILHIQILISSFNLIGAGKARDLGGLYLGVL